MLLFFVGDEEALAASCCCESGTPDTRLLQIIWASSHGLVFKSERDRESVYRRVVAKGEKKGKEHENEKRWK